MIHLGDFPTSHTAVCIPFDSFAASTGAPSATTNFAAGDILIYKDGGTTQRASSAGITVSTSFDSQTGLQMIVIDLSDNTDAGFYAAGHEYQVGVADITVDSQTLRFWAATFSIERAGGVLALLKGNAVKVDVNTIKTQAVTCAAGVTVLASVGTAATSTAQTGDGYARLGAPAGASVSADVAAVKTDTAAVKTQTDKLAFTGANKVDASVRDWVGDTIPARSTAGVPKVDVQNWTGTAVSAPATAGIPEVNVKNINNVATTPVTTVKAVQGLTTADTIATYTGNTPQTGDVYPKVDTEIATIITNIAALNNLSAAAVATAVWDALRADHVVLDSMGEAMGNIDTPIQDAVWSSLLASYLDPATLGGAISTLLSTADLSATVPDSVPADGTRPNVRQAVLMLCRYLMERSVAGTTMTVNKEDGTTPSMTFTTSDATNPTSVTRAS